LHPTLGRAIINIIFLLLLLNVFALFFLKSYEAEFYIAAVNLGILVAFFVIVVFEIKREIRSAELKA